MKMMLADSKFGDRYRLIIPRKGNYILCCAEKAKKVAPVDAQSFSIYDVLHTSKDGVRSKEPTTHVEFSVSYFSNRNEGKFNLQTSRKVKNDRHPRNGQKSS